MCCCIRWPQETLPLPHPSPFNLVYIHNKYYMCDFYTGYICFHMNNKHLLSCGPTVTFDTDDVQHMFLPMRHPQNVDYINKINKYINKQRVKSLLHIVGQHDTTAYQQLLLSIILMRRSQMIIECNSIITITIPNNFITMITTYTTKTSERNIWY